MPLPATRPRAGRGGVAGTRSTPARSAPPTGPAGQLVSGRRVGRAAASTQAEGRAVPPSPPLLREGPGTLPGLPTSAPAQGPRGHHGAVPAPHSLRVLKPLQDRGTLEPRRQESRNRWLFFKTRRCPAPASGLGARGRGEGRGEGHQPGGRLDKGEGEDAGPARLECTAASVTGKGWLI